MKKVMLIASFLAFNFSVNAQAIDRYFIGNGGGDIENEDVQFSQSFGQAVVGIIDNGLSFSQGFQNPYDGATSVFSLEEDLSFVLFPNPGYGEVSIDLGDFSSRDISLVVHNHLGQLATGEINNRSTFSDKMIQADFSNLAPGTYVISILENNKIISNQKLIILKK